MQTLIDRSKAQREAARVAVRDALAGGKPLSTIGLAPATGMNEPRCRRAADDLVDAGEVEKVGHEYRLREIPGPVDETILPVLWDKHSCQSPLTLLDNRDHAQEELDQAEGIVLGTLKALAPDFANRLESRLLAQEDAQSFRLAEYRKHLTRLLNKARDRLNEETELHRQERDALAREIDDLMRHKAQVVQAVAEYESHRQALESTVIELQRGVEASTADLKRQAILHSLATCMMAREHDKVTKVLQANGVKPSDVGDLIRAAADMIPADLAQLRDDQEERDRALLKKAFEEAKAAGYQAGLAAGLSAMVKPVAMVNPARARQVDAMAQAATSPPPPPPTPVQAEPAPVPAKPTAAQTITAILSGLDKTSSTEPTVERVKVAREIAKVEAADLRGDSPQKPRPPHRPKEPGSDHDVEERTGIPRKTAREAKEYPLDVDAWMKQRIAQYTQE